PAAKPGAHMWSSSVAILADVRLRRRTVGALRPPASLLVLVLNVVRFCRNALLAGGTFCGCFGLRARAKRLGENVADLVRPAAVMLDDLVVDVVHRSLLHA